MLSESIATPLSFRFDQKAPELTMQLIRGREEVLQHQAMLMNFADHCGQLGAVDYLGCFLTAPYVGGKTPCLSLIHDAGTEELLGAVLLYEYQVRGMATGVFVTDDESGERTVLAPAADRLRVASEVSEGLIRSGARLVLLSLRSDEPARVDGLQTRGRATPLRWTSRERIVRQSLSLAATYDATLAPMGKHTRRNLRASRRRAESELQAEFIASAEISLDDFVALNRLCAYPVPDHVSVWRYETVTKLSGGFMMGVRSAGGEWLSLLGGRRHHGKTEVGWQMNRKSCEAYSLSNVMRSYLIENEVDLGAHTLFFEGGTPQSMQSAFHEDRVIDLLISSKSLSAAALQRWAPRVLPERNPLSEMLRNPELVWSERHADRRTIFASCSALFGSARRIWERGRLLLNGTSLNAAEEVNG